MPLLAPEAIACLSNALFEYYGAPPAHARIVTDHLVEAGAMGLHSHGPIRIPQYLAEIEAGALDPAAVPRMTRVAPASLRVDGALGFGQVVGMAMVEAVAPLARRYGIAIATGRRMGHTGRVGAYPEALARAGLIGLAVSTGSPSGHWVAPFGGRDGRLGTNPIAYAVPQTDGEPIVADFSTAATAEGVVRSLHNRGLPAPEGFLQDAMGEPTTDPSVLYATPRGTIRPFGGALGYRGTALGLLVELVGTILAGDEADDRSRVGSNLTILAIVSDGGFAARAARLAGYLRSAAPIDPGRPVMLPGERERLSAATARTLLIDEPTWRALGDWAALAGLELPEPVAEGVAEPSSGSAFGAVEG